MSSVQRNLWILITLSAMMLIATKWIGQQKHERHYKCKKKYTCQQKWATETEEADEEEAPEIDAFVSVSQAPVPVNLEQVRRKIGYPAQASNSGIEGTVIARILVDHHGNYVRHKIIKSGHPILANAVSDELHKLGFLPARDNHKPVKCWVNIPISFQLINY